jgi:hypothetical protein
VLSDDALFSLHPKLADGIEDTKESKDVSAAPVIASASVNWFESVPGSPLSPGQAQDAAPEMGTTESQSW